jgi:hypothetical protein
VPITVAYIKPKAVPTQAKATCTRLPFFLLYLLPYLVQMSEHYVFLNICISCAHVKHVCPL